MIVFTERGGKRTVDGGATRTEGLVLLLEEWVVLMPVLCAGEISSKEAVSEQRMLL